jgi:hypothetical protein
VERARAARMRDIFVDFMGYGFGESLWRRPALFH